MDGIGTSDYYTENATQFAAATCELDLSDIYSRFLPLVTDGGHILDAGCGSGRDWTERMGLQGASPLLTPVF